MVNTLVMCQLRVEIASTAGKVFLIVVDKSVLCVDHRGVHGELLAPFLLHTALVYKRGVATRFVDVTLVAVCPSHPSSPFAATTTTPFPPQRST